MHYTSTTLPPRTALAAGFRSHRVLHLEINLGTESVDGKKKKKLHIDSSSKQKEDRAQISYFCVSNIDRCEI